MNLPEYIAQRERGYSTNGSQVTQHLCCVLR